MAQTRPRFGGGRIMETKATEAFFLPNDSGRKIHKTDSMEASLHTQPCGREEESKDKQEAGGEKTGIEALLGRKDTENMAPNNNPQWESQYSSEKDVKSFQSNEQLQINESRYEKGLDRSDEKSEQSFPVLRTHYVQNDSESRKGDFENREYPPEDFSDCGNEADVTLLMSILQSIGISVEVKPYVRCASTSSRKRHSGGEEVDNTRISRLEKPIDLNPPGLGNKPGNKSSKGDKKHHEDNFLYCKNLFLKDRHGHYYLIIAEESATVDFKILKKQLNAARNLSFADATATENILGEKSGGLNPFVAMRKSAHEVRFVLHQSLLEAKVSRTLLAFHPLDRSLQIEITVDDLIAFLEHLNKQLEILPADLSGSVAPRCLHSKSDEFNEEIDASKECKQTKIKATIVDNNDGDSQAVKLKKDNMLLNPIIDGKPLWKVHTRKGKLKSLLKATKDNAIKSEVQTSQGYAAVEEFSGKEPEMRGKTATQNPSTRKCRTVQNQFEDRFSKPRSQNEELFDESKFETDKIEQPNRLPDSSSIPDSSTLPEINQFYKNLSDLCIDYKDLHMGMSTTRDIGPSIGCKCFFLKDRRQNYYLIITHEYYELDHGRLKKALKPKKKLDHAEPADILANLGVQPSRITPFSCTTDRAIVRNEMVFMTEKIRPSEVILCIQHPFAEGRRLVMKSGELQRYLSSFISPIGEVEEKAWPEKFDRIFTRFTDQSNKQTLAPEASMHPPEQQHIVPADCPSFPIENKQQTGFTGEKEEHSSSSKTERHCAKSVSLSVAVLSEVCKRVGEVILILAGIDTHLISSSRLERFHVSSNGQIFPGSSVDPSADDTKEGHEACLNHKEDMMTKDGTENVTLAAERTTGEDLCTTESVKHGDHDLEEVAECELNGNNTPCKASHSDVGDTSLTVGGILQHLQNINVDFTFTDSSSRRYTDDELKQQSQKPSIMQFENGGEDRHVSREVSRDKPNNDDKKGDDHDNVEICSTAYMFDKENHYIIVGGESDYLTKRRFRRLFHLPGPMQMGDSETPGLTTSPFSLALTLRGKTEKKTRTPNVYVILFSSLYLDPETKCIFHLDPEGSTLTMTSSQFEYFINKTGMECWYVP